MDIAANTIARAPDDRRTLFSHSRGLLAAVPLLKRTWEAYKTFRFGAMKKAFFSRHGLVVRGGPFEGLKYVPESSGSALLPKLLGSYESALHSVLAEAIGTPYERIVDIGCAEGYYAVGLTYRCPGIPVVAFESSPSARELCRRLADLNGVSSRVTILGECTTSALETAVLGRSLIVCDVEGGEAELLDPVLVKGLTDCDLIVELHPFFNASIPRLMEDRFGQTHTGFLIHGRDGGRFPAELKTFKWFDRPLATWEERSGKEPVWQVLRSKRHPYRRESAGSTVSQT